MLLSLGAQKYYRKITQRVVFWRKLLTQQNLVHFVFSTDPLFYTIERILARSSFSRANVGLPLR